MPGKRNKALLAVKSHTAVSHSQAPMLTAVLLATLVVYLRCLGNGFVYDDGSMIVKDRYIGRWSFLWQSLFRDSWWFMNPSTLPQSSYYRPLQDIWLGLNYHLFALNPAGWHAATVALHLLVVWLVFKVAQRLTQNVHTPPLAALLFGLMPIHTEAVVWASAIPLPLSAAFELAAFYLFVARAGAERRNWPLAIGLYAAALLSHESAVAFPGLVFFYVWLRELPGGAETSESGAGPVWARLRRALVCVAPFAAELLLYFCLRWLVLGAVSRPSALNRATNAQALMTVPLVLLTYLITLAMPWLGAPAHRVLFVTNVASPEFYLPVAALLILAGVFFLLVRNDPRRRLYLFCVAWMAIAISPMMYLRGLFQHAPVQDRYLYLASVGWCLIAADCAVRFARAAAPAQRDLVRAGVAALIVVYAASLWNLQGVWHDDLTLFTRCVEKFPESSYWRRSRAGALEQRHDLVAAEHELEKAMSFDPHDGKTLYRLALAHMQLGRTKQATKEAADALKLIPDPLAGEYILLARLYDSQGDQARSEAVLKQAESLWGGIQAAGVARAQMKIAHGDASGAEAILRALTRRYPNDLLLWVELGLALAAQNRFDQALSAYGQALRIAPNDPSTHFLAAQTLHVMGRDSEALQQCRLVLAAVPDDANARALMAVIARAPSPH